MFKNWYLFLVLLIEGGALMAVELMGVKFLAPFYGSSLYVWTAVLAITVLGLTSGYYYGGKFSENISSEKPLANILIIASILVIAMPVTTNMVIGLTSKFSLILGICTASLLLLVPPMLCFGMIGPIVVKLMTQKIDNLGNVAGTVYFTSTFGGIVTTFLFGYYLIPVEGLRFSSFICALALGVVPILYWVGFFLSKSGITLDHPPVKQSQTKNKQKNTPRITRKSQNKNSIKNTIYGFAALEGASVMAIELMGARMLAPYFGSSLYVWTAVIGLTLFSLAIGYYWGGRLADKYSQINTIYVVLLVAAMLILLMHLIAQYLTTALFAVDPRVSVILIGLFLIVPPLVLLGTVPTLLIRYVTLKVKNSGNSTGRVFAISSASGILALPILGFYIIPQFGITSPSIFLGLLVGLIPFIKLISQKKYSALFFVFFLLFSISQRNIVDSSPNIMIREYSEGLLGQVLVADILKNAADAPSNERVLFVNRMGQTIQNKNTNISNWTYIPFSATAASILPENSQALLLGLGGGSIANVLSKQLQFEVDAVELDERIGRIARQYFALSPGVKVIIDDARHYLESTQKKYDLIYFDVFKGDTAPPHVLSIESFQRAKTLLNENGLIIINFNGFISGKTGRAGRSLNATLQAVGLQTKILPTPGAEKDRNLLFIAANKDLTFSNLRSELRNNDGQIVRLEDLFLPTDSLKSKDAIIFTDNCPNLDRLNMKASDIWRKSYNDTYTQYFLKHGIPLFN